MKYSKILIALLLCVVMIFTLVACGGEKDNVEDTNQPEVTEPEATEPEVTKPEAPKYEAVTIGDCVINFDGAEFVDFYSDGYTRLHVYYTFTNNAAEEKSAAQMVFVQAKAGDSTVSESTYPQDKAPEEQLNVYKKIAPGETIRCMVILSYDGTQADNIEITIMDLYHQAPDSLVLNIAAADLPILVEAN